MFLQNVKCLRYGTLRYVTLREDGKHALVVSGQSVLFNKSINQREMCRVLLYDTSRRPTVVSWSVGGQSAWAVVSGQSQLVVSACHWFHMLTAVCTIVSLLALL